MYDNNLTFNSSHKLSESKKKELKLSYQAAKSLLPRERENNEVKIFSMSFGHDEQYK